MKHTSKKQSAERILLKTAAAKGAKLRTARLPAGKARCAKHIAEPTGVVALYAKWEPLAYKMTTGWTVPGYDTEDLQQEARIAIYNTARAFDPAKGCFYTVAKRSIHNRLASLLTKARAKKRTAFMQSLDAPLADDGMEFHELLAGMDFDASMPRGVGVFETVRNHLIKRLQDTPKCRRKVFLSRVTDAVRNAESAYGFELGDLSKLAHLV